VDGLTFNLLFHVKPNIRNNLDNCHLLHSCRILKSGKFVSFCLELWIGWNYLNNKQLVLNLMSLKNFINKTPCCLPGFLCRPGGTRTLDPLIKSQLLCQLSYGPYLSMFPVQTILKELKGLFLFLFCDKTHLYGCHTYNPYPTLLHSIQPVLSHL
jgi:hypothetical protein